MWETWIKLHNTKSVSIKRIRPDLVHIAMDEPDSQDEGEILRTLEFQYGFKWKMFEGWQLGAVCHRAIFVRDR